MDTDELPTVNLVELPVLARLPYTSRLYSLLLSNRSYNSTITGRSSNFYRTHGDRIS